MDTNTINLFKERKVKAKDIFTIKQIDKKQAENIIEKFHYLGKKKFMYTVAYGLFEKDKEDEILGCAVFGVVGGSLALKGWFSVDNSHSNEYFELTRLVMNPSLNGCNATSYLLGNAIKDIKRNFTDIKAIISLADNSLHNGAIYQACNFKYFGLTNPKTDFCVSGSSFINQRVGTTKDKEGVWIPRSRKHRYCYIIDKNTNINYKEGTYPKGNAMNIKPNCCNGTNKVYDKRYKKWYTCPRCTGKCEEIKEDMSMEYIELFTDGGARNNGKADNIGAYGFLLKYIVDGKIIAEKSYAEAERNTTNNIQELKGLINGLKAIKNKNIKLKVYLDSSYVKNGIEKGGWIEGWIKNNWITSSKKPVKNKELWQELYKLTNEFTDISYEWIKGHQNVNNGNDIVDKKLNEAMDELNKG